MVFIDSEDSSNRVGVLWAFQVLHNAVGGWRLSDFPEKGITKIYG